MPLILIVDDSPTEVFVMQKALEKHGFRPSTHRREHCETGLSPSPRSGTRKHRLEPSIEPPAKRRLKNGSCA